MGIIRKTASLGTMGIIPFNNAAEKAVRRDKAATRSAKMSAKYAKQTRNAARVSAVGSVVGVVQNQAMLNQGLGLGTPVPRVQVPAGWYPDPSDARMVCWWDGVQWHPQTKRWPK